MVDIEFIGQLVDSMGDAVLQLERALTRKKNDDANKLRTFIFDLSQQIEKAINSKDV